MVKIAGAELHQYYSGLSRSSSRDGSQPESGKPGNVTEKSAPVQRQGSTDTSSAVSDKPSSVSNKPSAEKEGPAADKKESDTKQSKTGITQKLDPEELAVINDLKRTDREVKAHEAAHVAAGGQYVTGGAQFEYQTGPDGKKYAVGGEVQIDTSEVAGDPEATIAKMDVVRRAALAPGNPSSQDRSVAAAASQKQAQARLEARKEKQNEDKAGGEAAKGQQLDRTA